MASSSCYDTSRWPICMRLRSSCLASNNTAVKVAYRDRASSHMWNTEFHRVCQRNVLASTELFESAFEGLLEAKCVMHCAQFCKRWFYYCGSLRNLLKMSRTSYPNKRIAWHLTEKRHIVCGAYKDESLWFSISHITGKNAINKTLKRNFWVFCWPVCKLDYSCFEYKLWINDDVGCDGQDRLHARRPCVQLLG